ncbi:hypothetical protein Bpfe_003559 [Biomphalaria pfeifferi]|uniref:Uncharacterized protein n=1 Tax=Biomphalaria pfeifferi TaxID=112525 RepID=A0AAD8C5H6_BIOPF|nr:hypothetical protein Bpfe_003559 [Biomphalaria pfeifferi]
MKSNNLETSITCRTSEEGATTIIDIVWNTKTNITVRRNALIILVCVDISIMKCKSYDRFGFTTSVTEEPIASNIFNVTLLIFKTSRNTVDGKWILERMDKKFSEYKLMFTICNVLSTLELPNVTWVKADTVKPLRHGVDFLELKAAIYFRPTSRIYQVKFATFEISSKIFCEIHILNESCSRYATFTCYCEFHDPVTILVLLNTTAELSNSEQMVQVRVYFTETEQIKETERHKLPRIICKIGKILKENSHPLHHDNMKSSPSGRLLTIKTRPVQRLVRSLLGQTKSTPLFLLLQASELDNKQKGQAK